MNLESLTGSKDPLQGITVREGLGPITGSVLSSPRRSAGRIFVDETGAQGFKVTCKPTGDYYGVLGNKVNIVVFPYNLDSPPIVRYYIRFFDYLGGSINGGGLVSTGGAVGGATTSLGICNKMNGIAAYNPHFEFTVLTNIDKGLYGFGASTFDASKPLSGGRG